jgi:hypothetical protein
MKRIVEEQTGQGLEALLGEYVAVWCLNYIYAGKLVGVNEHDIILSEPKVVYETGKLTDPGFSDAQELPASEWRILTACIESYGEMK